MEVVLVIHLILALGIICLVLVQRSEGGGLGIGGSGGGGLGNLASAHSTANALTRTTAIFAACFFATSLILAILAGTHTKPQGLLADLEAPVASIVVPSDEEGGEVAADTTEEAPAAESRPSVPVSE